MFTPTKVTFENEVGEKCIVNMFLEEDKLCIHAKFEPEVNGKNKETYVLQAMSFINQFLTPETQV